MSRKWLVLTGIAALVVVVGLAALVGGGALGRKIVPDRPASTTPAKETAAVRLKDTLTDVSIEVPVSWTRGQPRDQQVRIVASAVAGDAAVSVSVRPSGLDAIDDRTLPVAQPLVEQLVRENKRITKISAPAAVNVDGLPGYRYVYTYKGSDGKEGADLHYYLFKSNPGRLIQVVLQAVPAARYRRLEPIFIKIAESLKATPA